MGRKTGEERIGENNFNKQGCLMKIIKYNSSHNIIVEFQDEYKANIKTTYSDFKNGKVRNPYHISVLGVGITGNKYKIMIDRKQSKEYIAWLNIIKRCFDNAYKLRFPTYTEATCCKEWLLFENFYEWLHIQENFIKWLNGDRWAVDKDILIKNNKLYSPDTCCLVPNNINQIFVNEIQSRGKYPLGVYYSEKENGYIAQSRIHQRVKRIGKFNSVDDAFKKYKEVKEKYIK